MVLEMPETHFTRSKYFVQLKPEETSVPSLTLALKEGASDADKRELEEFVNYGLKAKIGQDLLKELRIKDPYWTWDGKLIEKSFLPANYPYNKHWKGIWKDYSDMLKKIDLPEQDETEEPEEGLDLDLSEIELPF